VPTNEADVTRTLNELAQEMERHGADRDAPVRSIMAMLGDRWTMLILQVLATGEWRHAELRRILAKLSAEQDISQRVLTLKLRALEKEGLVVRIATADVPPKVSYELSGLGRSLHGQVFRLIAWIETKAPAILQARDDYDQAQRERPLWHENNWPDLRTS